MPKTSQVVSLCLSTGDARSNIDVGMQVKKAGVPIFVGLSQMSHAKFVRDKVAVGKKASPSLCPGFVR
jgi:hypothetical protein